MRPSLAARVGELSLVSPILTAAGTAGYGDELGDYGDLAALGAVVVKSLAAFEWAGNPAPRVTAQAGHMVNSVGLAGPGVTAWRERDLPRLRARGATVVASVWGRTVEEFAAAAALLAGADVAAVEVNASCPNLEDRSRIFAHSPSATAEVVDACRAAGRPLWVKLSPNPPDLGEVASAGLGAGATALVLVNTLLGLAVDVEARRPALGGLGGGVSGPGILPVALRAVADCAPLGAPVVGVGGVARGEDAIAMVMAGASAVEVGSATFADPRAPWRVARGVARWMARHGVAGLDEIRGVARA
ncbi:MAG TPA: dihydroorotate dehydrogenase [Acidimicrobiales bacterium]|nr:dihydroorotate dehydrogenase [Acidimicrobiales bacterium]